MRFLVVLLFCLLAFPLPSFAAPPTCSVVSEGVIVYNKDHKVMQYCDGVNWIGMSGSAAESIDTLGALECDTGEIAKYDGTAWTCSEDTGGLAALQGTNDPGPCTVAKDGLIKYNASGTPKWHYCDGGTTSWLPFRLPQCQNDDAGDCTLTALRDTNDPQFKPSSIRCGDKLLGVTGTYGGGSSNAFTYTNVTNANLSTLTTASAATIGGIPAGCPGEVSVAGTGTPQISINGGAWGTTGAITNGQTLAVRLTSSASFGTANTATISIGSTDSVWSVTTLAADTTPVAFDFTPDVTNAALSTVTTASAVTITGINTTTPVSVSGSGAQISINGGAWNTTGTITGGQTLAVRLTSSASFSTAITATVDVGGVTDTWSVTTLAADTTPVAFDFTPNITNAALGTLTTASAITITGINTTTPVSVTGSGAEISINGGAWGTTGNIASGQTLALRLTSSASFSTAITATVDVGGITDTWSVTTLAADTTPDAFAFTDRTDIALSTLTTSNAVTIAGINTSASVSVTGSGSPEISINGGAWVTSGTIANGQTLSVRLTSSAAYSTALAATVSVGTATDTWTVTSQSAVTIVNIVANASNINLFSLAGSPSVAGSYEFRIASGVTINSTASATAAVVTGAWPVGSTVKLVNNGKIYGRGGNGGNGGTYAFNSHGAGTAGGHAIQLGHSISIDNTNGQIFGGGGGGSGGTGGHETDPTIYYEGGGGGGGQGSGNSVGGAAGGAGAGVGGPGTVSAVGAGGAGEGCAGVGGAGGAWGSPGGVGAVSYCSIDYSNTKPGGAAGNSIKTNSYTATFIGGNNAAQVKGPVN